MRFLSCEPLLGPLDLDLDGIHWVIAGGESGPGARPMRPEWAQSVRDQCLAAGVPFFFKQWGAHDASGTRMSKKAAGRLLDGVGLGTRRRSDADQSAVTELGQSV